MVITEILALAAILAFAAPFIGMFEPIMGVVLVCWVMLLITIELCWRRWETWKAWDNGDDDDDDEGGRV